ncbi:Dihydrosphingosine 1-phosphate phosphatase [Fulvia fulva]|uniref:Dihydrosphingosine 1-phosphate phosphatase n=1 Tax=Passalora fulva TaxID=5499 RepID=A0A9Q8USF4_PASFU|nr:Dihydrosphingosine 1-phosphate phosphatase [Fulvia fulva]KAK4618190.1 Dihydrosphingosine 1-phosphate phosphatase [Fulvia fulva]KAK4618601.1 Dihydrosphingosine 1-phosphate phosphatase [Fulvia fulva]UJO20784.1 Dihydrosphingosine 1-phosphate phosphatase [Fulvia fulva]WPV18157.1 Dihydrosphingosine 1-phosphate phosphatase [Fulvia fulva]WPV32832.1 Dihydrosphingosine 1-phosphate phosphatase [Fulvia fulva]
MSLPDARPTTPLRFQAHLRTPSPDPDAGLRGLSHYERRLPKWRYQLRHRLIPIVRWETPYLARMQHALRSPLLDTYFALTANLGTHTFFMTALPICFWCGYPELGIALVQMLAAGVYFSGYVKDMVCLPRPLSPPLQRITMSGSAALEYGFPSTHTTNAVSVAIYCLYNLWQTQDEYSLWQFRLLNLACLCYATSISIGRMYCGMHGFFDVVFGAALGALITAFRVLLGPAFDAWVIAGDWTRPAIAVGILALAVQFHPEPADNCPCYDDSVAFIGVLMGISTGSWNYVHLLSNADRSAAAMSALYNFANRDLFKIAARLIGGIIVVFLWRATMKPLLLRGLPPIFRLVAHYGLNIPRRYFLQARDYNTVPTLRKDDKVLPPASDIPAMLSSIRRRKRTISVGPQSEADAREYIANRAQQRRDRSRSPQKGLQQKPSRSTLRAPTTLSIDEHAPITPDESPKSTTHLSVQQTEYRSSPPTLMVTAPTRDLFTPPASDNGNVSDSGKEDESHDKKMFSALEKPRIRYDVEVITKLVVYAGIAWLAVEGNPLLFAKLGIT